ncbi:leucine-rich repeat domain-containing protein [Bacillus benzoevorans]|uniref:Leucine-rich repeat (LRR) protein n=1 Tax=Bacillus benzoevorans TaxID=1456 RepID=A0A7X0HX96_9BACI|nr:leucine-rich repeat domain-containing protein [Bacillus benzoevorans]MBB6447306.1 Leucine-rich repeat (LRR) protein [Bacillus benzoevorans]
MKKLPYLVLFVLVLGLVAPLQGQAEGGFKDVSTSYTFYDEVLYLSGKEVIAGFSDGTFKPNNTVTRAQAAMMLGRALNLNGEPRNTKFKDVTAYVTGSGYIAAAVEKGIISGFTDGTYRPHDAVTRGQMAIFLNQAFSLTTGNENGFSDVSSKIAAYQSILNVSANGIASGYADGTYRPNLAVTRGQFSAFMARALEPSFRAEVVHFSDKNFEKAIRDTLHKPAGNITAADMDSINKIEAKGYAINHLTGIEYAKNLTYLDLGMNEISDISRLAGLTKLRVLHLPSNNISDISALSGLNKLEIVNLAFNDISDIRALKGLTEIFMLNLFQNDISDISALRGLTKLTDLDLTGNEISDISALSEFKTLYVLALSYNNISDINVLSELKTLQDLALGGNQISDISFLSGLTNLHTLRLHNNKIADISALSDLTKLTSLYLSFNEINDIQTLKRLTKLEELDLAENELSDILVLGNLTNLKILDLTSTGISDILVLSKLTKLRILYLSANKISDITPLNDLADLELLTIRDNELNAASHKVIKNLEASGVTVTY